MKINSTESYVFFLTRTYRARIQLSFTNTRCIQYSLQGSKFDPRDEIQAAQRVTIAHLSPMCQGQFLFKKSGDTNVLDAQGQ